MNPRLKLWSVSALLYALFVVWYTDFGGPLEPDEISHFLTQMEARGGSTPEMLENIATFMREDTGRQFLMVNIIDYNENPPDVEGAEPGENAEQLMDRYMAYMFPALLRRACHPTVMGNASFTAMDIVGIENARVWDMGAMMRYRSRRSLMEIVANSEQGDSHRFKVAALDKTIAFPIEPRLYLADLRLILGLLLLAVTALLDSRLVSRGATR
jgi:hypothetical protein